MIRLGIFDIKKCLFETTSSKTIYGEINTGPNFVHNVVLVNKYRQDITIGSLAR